MTMFHQDRGACIRIRSGDQEYVDTLANFTVDFGSSPPSLPAGCAERIYEPGRRHALNDAAGHTVAGGPRNWGFGDQVIAVIADLIGAKHERDNPNPTLEQVQARRCLDVNKLRDEYLVCGYSDHVTAKIWQCDTISQGKWTAIGASAGLALLAGTDPAPEFEMIAADNAVVRLSAHDAFALLNGRVMPWVSATMLRARVVKNDILTATSIPAVESIDIAAGWPAP